MFDPAQASFDEVLTSSRPRLVEADALASNAFLVGSLMMGSLARLGDLREIRLQRIILAIY